MTLDEKYINQTFSLARRGISTVSPNPMVGAIIVKANKVLATGWHRKFGLAHAEVEALKKAGAKAKGATLYVNLEPCYHYGKTPPCVDAIIQSGIKRVVIAQKDPNSLTNGKSIKKLKKSGIAVSVGVLNLQAIALNEAFNKYIATQKPFIVAKIAQTIDGKIACTNGQSKWITSKATRSFAKSKRSGFDAIVCGINTILKDDPVLNPDKGKERYAKIIVDSTLRIPRNARVFSDRKRYPCLVATTDKASKEKIKQLNEKEGIEVIVVKQKDGKVSLKALLKILAKKEFASILIEGGAHLIGSALKEDLVDKMNIYISPKIVGDQSALSSIIGLNTLNINRSLSLKKLKVASIGADIFVEGYLKGK